MAKSMLSTQTEPPSEVQIERADAWLLVTADGLRVGKDIKGGEVTANELLWRFFQSHPLPQP